MRQNLGQLNNNKNENNNNHLELETNCKYLNRTQLHLTNSCPQCFYRKNVPINKNKQENCML